MKTNPIHADLQLMQHALGKVHVITSTESSPNFPVEWHCSYRCNPDGTIRWVWPTSCKSPHFLRFYHYSNAKSILFVLVVRLMFLLGLKKFFAHGQFSIYSNKERFPGLDKTQQNQWALFTGTVGPNRKLVLWRAINEQESVFTKIAFSESGIAIINAEREVLQQINAQKFTYIEAPMVMKEDIDNVTISNVATGVKRTNRMGRLPYIAVQEWMEKGLKKKDLKNLAFWKVSLERMNNIANSKDAKTPADIVHKLSLLIQPMSAIRDVAVCRAHGDFTPWNVFIKDNRLSLIDWELSQPEMPTLYDLFHFVYQSNILIGNKGYKAIRAELQHLFQQPVWVSFLQQHQVDAGELEQLYLIYTISYYANLYNKQTVLHTQVAWLFNTWSEALSFFLEKNGIVETRKLLLQDMTSLLKTKEAVILKFMAGNIDALPENSDLDICITKKEAQKFLHQLRIHPLVEKTKISKRSHMMQVTLILVNGSLVHLDLIWQLKRKAIDFLSVTDVLESTRHSSEGIKVPSIAYDFAYTWLFYQLNGAQMPERYRNYFASIPESDAKSINKLVKQYLPQITSFDSLYTKSKNYHSQIELFIRSRKENSGLPGVINKLNYFIDTLRNSFPRKGCIITFSGVDGAGKSTIIERTKQHVEKNLRNKVVVLRHRPSLLPILSTYKYGKKDAEQKAATTLPRQGTNGSKLSSAFRFAYYYMDYAVGQIYVQVRYVWQGYIVLYDRYYFDFINDSRRSNIALPKSFTTWCYRFLVKPELNFFLYAQPEEILKRKQELDAPTITLLTTNYLQLFEKLGKKYHHSKYVPIYNTDIDQTLGFIFKNIKKVRS